VPRHTPKSARGRRKIREVLGEFHAGALRSSSGAKVRNPKQATAIALSEALAAEDVARAIGRRRRRK